MKQSARLFILLVLTTLLITACQSSAPPDDADVAILFTEGTCELVKVPEGDIPNPIRIAAKNTTNEDYGIPVVTLQEGYTKEDLEAYKTAGEPPFLADFITLIVPDQKGDWLVEEVELAPGMENFVVCAHSVSGVLSVPIVLIP